jgi:hypothetical protein
MCGDHCPVPDIEGVCQYEYREEAYSTLTPKGYLAFALLNNDIHLDDNVLDAVWGDFTDIMIERGYVEEEGE